MKQYNKRNHSFEKFTHYKNKSQYFFYNQPLFSASLFNVPIHLRSNICPLLSVLTCIGHAASQTDQSFDGHGLCISQPTLCKFLLLLFNFFLASSCFIFNFILFCFDLGVEIESIVCWLLWHFISTTTWPIGYDFQLFLHDEITADWPSSPPSFLLVYKCIRTCWHLVPFLLINN